MGYTHTGAVTTATNKKCDFVGVAFMPQIPHAVPLRFFLKNTDKVETQIDMLHVEVETEGCYHIGYVILRKETDTEMDEMWERTPLRVRGEDIIDTLDSLATLAYEFWDKTSKRGEIHDKFNFELLDWNKV